MTWKNRIQFNPKIMGGKPVIKGTRVPIQIIVGSLAGGMTEDEVSREYHITNKDIKAALAYAADTLTEEKVHALSH
ncbi:MAG: hypothetical protein A2252_05665 [Elusimicrobia bacterium RIFOXYA2_FULL_39_19]|nr:MAG: hypothetical protein A2252_05665 [Elusimicrobia bacterium RIFOXYA2_FULL_39_19]